MVMCNGKLYFAPFFAREIGTYDLRTGEFGKIPILVPEKRAGWDWSREKFFKVMASGKLVYFLPCHYPGILCYDTETGTFDLYDQWVDEVERMRISEWWYFFDYELSGSTLYLPCGCADSVVMIDIVQKKTRMLKVPGGDFPCRFCGISQNAGYFYLLRGDGVVVKRRLETEEENEKIIRLSAKNDEEEQEITFYPVCQAGRYLYFFPFLEGNCFRLDMEHCRVEPVKDFDDEQSFEGSCFLFLTSLWDGETLYATGGRSRLFLECHQKQREVVSTGLFLREDEQRFLEDRKRTDFLLRNRQREIYENEWDSLGLLMSVFEKEEDAQNLFLVKKSVTECITYGEGIYRILI